MFTPAPAPIPEAPGLTLLHLSDLHFGQDQKEATSRFNQALVTRRLLEDIRAQVAAGLKPDYILVTGDIAFSAQAAEYNDAADWLRKVCDACGLEPGRLLLVPGNHDVDRKKALAGAGSWVHLGLRAQPLQLSEMLKPEQHPQFQATLWPKLTAYATFAQTLSGRPLTSEKPFWSLPLETALSRPVVALGLNSCLLSFDGNDAPSNLALGLAQLETAFSELPENALVLALLHHPLEWLVDGGPNQHAQVQVAHTLLSYLQKLPHILFYGHVHVQGGLVSQPLHTGGLVRFVAGAGHESVSEGGHHAYAWVRMHGAGLDFYPRFWNPERQRFQPEANRFELVSGQAYVRLKRTKLSDALEAWLETATRVSAQDSASAAPIPHLLVPPAFKAWAKKEYDTLTPLIATQSPISFRLERVYVELHSRWQAPEELQAAQKKSKKTGSDDRNENSRPPRRSIPALLEVNAVRLLALKGGPGSGKSTALRRLLLSRLEARGAAAGTQDALLPLYLELKELGVWLKAHPTGGTAPEQLLTWAGERLEKHGLSAEALRQRSGHGRMLWLLDGLDEIFQDELRLRAAQLIGGFFRHAPGNADRLLITGRPHAFDDARVVCALGLEQHVADLDELTDDERAEFLQKWFGEVYPHNAALAQEQAQALTRAIPQHEQVNALSRTPLLLSTMAAVYHMGRVLPERRADLYDKAVEVMLQRRFGGQLSPGDYTQRQARRALRVAARDMMLSGKVRSLARLEFERVIREVFHPGGLTEEQQKKLDELTLWLGAQSGLLALTGDPLRVTFSHYAFQEFLCAEWYADQTAPLEALGGKLDEPAWQEVVLLMGGRLLMEGLALPGERLLDALLEKSRAQSHGAWRTALLAKVVMEAPDGSLPVGFVEQLKPRLVEVMGGKVEPSTYRERVVVGHCLGKLGDPRLGLEKPENWIYLPPGKFMMGSEEVDSEKPIHPVTLTQGFYLSRFLVTNHDFRPFVEGDGYRNRQWWSEEGWAFKEQEQLTEPLYWQDAQWNAPNQPVVGISWFEAQAFCAWLSTQRFSTELRGPFRLPTEAEWEYAARGKEGWRFPWGNEAETPERAKYGQTGLDKTSPVGAFPLGATPEGLLDLAGNVWEWCEDGWANNDETTPRDGSAQPEGAGALRVVRGGAWDSFPDWLRSSFRSGAGAGGRDDNLGFRLVAVSSRPWHGLQGP